MAASLLVGAVLSIMIAAGLSWGRSTGRPAVLFDPEIGRWLERPLQPELSIAISYVGFAMKWERSVGWDLVSIRRNVPSCGPEDPPYASQVDEVIADDRATQEAMSPHGAFRSEWLTFADRGDKLRDAPPSWAYPVSLEKTVGLVETAAYGWPVRVLRCRGVLQVDATDPYAVTGKETDGLGGFANPWVAHPAWGVARKPIWLNLAMSSLIYGAAVWLTMFGLGSARRVWRSRHSQCLACGYDISGLAGGDDVRPCPECGCRS